MVYTNDAIQIRCIRNNKQHQCAIYNNKKGTDTNEKHRILLK